jgi:dihydroneopterin aldolase/2-amino-4-hydroxy-6-hydroxymethyldihydropteridine diphosphokinase/dihydropteroate synthase/2-amino-4-hydroxy-6-hydroxymethyldihydropteridine diphosphokinase/dihydropteroate synthase
LDILYYDNVVVISQTLVIPHTGIPERDFVLTPLLDVAPAFIHPILHCTTKQMYNNVRSNHPSTIKRILPVRDRLLDIRAKTYIMGILNITPDSFSDGGRYLRPENALSRAKQLIEQGANIIDVGGQSTRPGAERVPMEEELARVLPVIKALRQADSTILISVDTFYANVASESIAAGADIINDVTGGSHDPMMFAAAAKLKVPFIVMDNTPTQQYEMPRSTNAPLKSDIIDHVVARLENQSTVAFRHGVNKWQLILDPGLGFSKTYDQSIELIRRANELVSNPNWALEKRLCWARCRRGRQSPKFNCQSMGYYGMLLCSCRTGRMCCEGARCARMLRCTKSCGCHL